jgi:hypothetical protein
MGSTVAKAQMRGINAVYVNVDTLIGVGAELQV